ncbi:SHOCT domain-containing protein [Halobacteriaceae archaeon GCM10025711]
MASTTDDSLLRVVLVVLAVLLLLPVLMMAFVGPMMGMWMTGSPMGGVTPLWTLGVPLVFVAVLVAVGYLLYRTVAGGTGADPALEELRMAYARGDLTDDEFEERRRRLHRDSGDERGSQ